MNGTVIPTQEAVNNLARLHFSEPPTTKDLMKVWPDDWYSISYLKKLKTGISIWETRKIYFKKSQSKQKITPTQRQLEKWLSKKFKDKPRIRDVEKFRPNGWYRIEILSRQKKIDWRQALKNVYGQARPKQYAMHTRCDCGEHATHKLPHKAGDIPLCGNCWQLENS